MSIESIMTLAVVQVKMDDSLRVIGQFFQDSKIHHIMVVEEKRLIGVISDRDYLKSISPFIGTASELERDTATLHKRAHQIMSRKLITITPEASLEEAARLLLEHKISCLPVVTGDSHIEGIITWRDIIKAMTASSYRAS